MRRRTFLSLAAATTAGQALPSWARGRPLRVGVVGAGIVGASIAYHLAEAGAQVAIFEKTGAAAGATRNSFAWINAFVADAHYRDVRLQSLLAYHELDRRLGLNIVWGGYLNWAADASQAQLVHDNAAQLAGSAYPVIPVTSAEVAALSPHLAAGPISAALYSAIDGHLDPVFVTERFLAGAKAYGAKLHCPCELEALHFERGRLKSAKTSQGAFALDRLIVAAGVDTPRVLSLCGFQLKLRHAPGILAHSVPTAELTRIIHDAPEGLSFKQMASGRIVGTDAPEPPDLPVHAGIRAGPMDFPDEALRSMHGERILGKIARYLPEARGAKLEWLSLGFRPMPIDEYPVVGALPATPDVHVTVTHSGVTLAPVLGRWVSAETLDGTRIAALSTYRPERFSAGA